MNKTQESPVNTEEQPPMTREQYEKARKEEQLHLKKEISWLKTECEYEKLQADIEEHKTRRITMIAQQAKYYAAQQEMQAKPPVADVPKKPSKASSNEARDKANKTTRKLKTN